MSPAWRRAWLSWLFLELADSVHRGFGLSGIVVMVLCLNLLLIHQSRDWVLEHTEEADPDAGMGRVAGLPQGTESPRA
ncbi:hypothetical protein B1H20_08925 [Streptomyces violaceoruber]|uniref:Uncharacterized protein n=1 Tax=Streptomyces violaceoruber TaxID=1935 RepID=A0A1V0U8E9_STRVN|nr:hypothetical protein B1H20_08925 [Streptomyces violaceoruber]